MRRRAARLMALLTCAIALPAQAGSWKYELDQQDHSTLTYSEDGKVTFFLGCGHTFALHVKYPGEARKEGDASITIASGKKSMTFKGAFEQPDEDYATTFEQYDLGYRRQDINLYGKRWKAQRDRMLGLLDSGMPLTISARGNSYTLPPITASGWRKALGQCG